jgi:hypothetical protein
LKALESSPAQPDAKDQTSPVHHISLQPDAGSSLRCSTSLLTGGKEKKSSLVESKFLFFLKGTGQQNLCKIFHLTKIMQERERQRRGREGWVWEKKI